MGSLIVLLVISFIVFVWVRKTRTARKSWLQQLNLPGTWELKERDSTTIEFIGELSGGNYMYSENNLLESGSWHISGSGLVLKPEETQKDTIYELRSFKPGEIGINGPGKERQIYQKRIDNVVQLRPRA